MYILKEDLMKKRVLSMFMALALCLTLLPAPAWATEANAPEGGTIVQEEQQEKTPAAESPAILGQAAENGIAAQNGGDSTVENAVAEVTIGSTITQYDDINKAITAAQNSEGSTVKLLADVTTTSEIEVDSGTFTIDLNGKKLDRTSPFTLSVKENGNVTVTSTQGTGTISNAQNTAIFVNDNATVHVTKGVRLNQLYTMTNANLTLDVGVIITGTFFTKADNIAPFLAGKALQSCDENGTLIEGQYKSIYDSYRMDDTGCVVVIEHKSCTGTPSTETPCPICGYDGTQTKPTEPENPNPDVAEVNGTKYKTLAAAIQAANGADITLLTIVSENVVVDGDSIKAGVILGNGATINAIPYPSNWVADRNGIPLTMEAGEITLKDGALAQLWGYASANNAIALKGGTLIVETTVTKIIGSNRSDSVQHAAIEATGGVLDLQGNTLLDGGLTMSGDAQLKNKLTAGTFTNSGSETYSVSVEGSSQYGAVFDLLETGYAFAKYDESAENKAGAIIDGSVKQLTEDVIVVAHTHSPKCTQNPDPDALQTYIYICDCGFVCPHDRFTNSICDICHAACTHDEYTSDDKCARCGAPFAVRVECTDSVGITSNKLYMKTTTQDGTDDTLRQIFNEAADGSTITLLANGTLPYGIYASKTLTLDLNGHSLSGHSLNVGGSTATGQALTGNLTVIDSRGGNGAVGVTVRDGGTLVFDPENDSTTLLQLEVWGGKVELHGGKILRKDLRLNNSITLGDLLPQKAGLAYYCGDTQLTLKEAASKTCDLVVKSCAHGGKNGFDGTNCPYCNAPAVAETALNNGEGNRLQRRFADLQTALDADRDGGAELTLLADVTGDYTINGTQDTGLNLQGHSIKGTVTVKAAAGRNTTTLSNTKNTTTASIDAVVAHRGANLAGSRYPAVIGKLTLADTTQWKNILQQPTRLGFRVTNADSTYKWYAPDDVNGSQLNNVIINSLPITTKTLNLKVDGKNLTGSSPKVEHGTTVQLCASCNKGAEVTFSIKQDGKTTPITLTEPSYAGGKYTKDYSFDTIGEYTIYFTATKDGYTVQSNHKKLTVTKPNLSNAEITFRSSNESTYEPYRSTTTAPGFTVTYNGKTLKLGVDYTASGTASSAGVSTQTLTIKAVEGSDYTGSKTAEWRIVPHKAKVEVGDVIKAYDGTTDLPDGKISLVSAAGSAGYQAGLPLPLSEGNGFELTDAKYDSANASETEKNISFTVKLTDTNYTFEDGTTEKAFTLNGAELEDKSFKINKAAAPTNIQSGTLNIINGTQQTYTYDFKELLPELSESEYGTISYGNQAAISLVPQSGYYYDETIVEFKKGKLTLAQFYAKDGNMTGQIGTVKVNVTTTNYADFQLTLVLNAINQIKPTPDGEITAAEITYGDTLSKSKISGKMKDLDTGKEVEGTFAWKNKYDLPIQTGDWYVDWTFTPDESYGGIYATVTGIVKVPVAPKSIEGAAITLEKYEFQYNAVEQSLRITGVTLENWDETRITYVIKSGDKATDANDSITLTIEGTGNYTGKATVEWKITPREVTPTIEVASCTYTGDALEPTVTLKDGAVVISEGEYTVEYSNNTNAGTGRVAIQDVEGGNYIVTSISRDFPIDQAAAPTNIQHGTLSVINGTHLTYTYDFQQLLPEAPNGDYGTVHYDLGNRQTAISFTAHGYYIDPEIVEFEGSKLTLVGLYAKDGTATGQIGTVKVNVTTTNYTDFNLTLVLNAVDRITPVADGSITASKITYGQTLSESRISGKMKDGDTVVEGTFSWQQPDDTILGASTLGHSVGWKFTPKDGNTYTEATGTATVKVDKAQQYGKVSMAGYTYGQAPSTPTLTDRTGDLNAQVTYGYAVADSGSVQTWDISNPPALNAGTYRMYASIGDTDNYYGFEAVYCEFVVAKATPTYTAPTGLTAKYGQTLADVTLPDGWSWTDSSESVGGASTAAKTFQAKFTPTDTENYNAVENIELEVMVNKADGGSLKTVELAQKYTDASVHTYTPDWSGLPSGQAWSYNSDYSVSTGSNVTLAKHDFAADGSLLTYAISGGKAGDKITLTLKASCDNYEDFTITLNVTLTEKDDQKPLTITGADSVFYGQALTLTTSGGSGTGAVTYRIDTAHSTGEATIDPETGVLTPVKVGSVSVIATKAGNNDYNDVTSAPFVLMIKPATPTGEPNYTKITTSGKTLKDAALTIEGSTLNPSDGKLEWVDDKGNVLPDSTRIEANTTYRWRFTPTGANYATLTGKIELYHESSSGGGGWYDSYYTIEATAGTGGSISPSGNISVREGADQTFTITPDKGYAVANVKIDGESIGAVKSYTFENVSKAHTIEVIFVKGTASASTGDSSDLLLWSALLLASTLTLAGAVHYKRKRAR